MNYTAFMGSVCSDFTFESQSHYKCQIPYWEAHLLAAYIFKQKGASILLAFAQHKQMPCPYRVECSLECLEPLLLSNVECVSWLFQGQPITVTESNFLFNKWLIPDMY